VKAMNLLYTSPYIGVEGLPSSHLYVVDTDPLGSAQADGRRRLGITQWALGILCDAEQLKGPGN
jgi:hypothetical protein